MRLCGLHRVWDIAVFRVEDDTNGLGIHTLHDPNFHFYSQATEKDLWQCPLWWSIGYNTAINPQKLEKEWSTYYMRLGPEIQGRITSEYVRRFCL